MADDIEPTAEIPGDEPTDALDEVPDEPTVTLDITQMTADEPAEADIPVVVVDATPQPGTAPNSQRTQLMIGAAVATVLVLIVVVVLAFTGGDDTSTGVSANTTSPTVSTLTNTSTPGTTTVTTSATSTPTTAFVPGEMVTPVPFYAVGGHAFAFSPDSRRLAASSADEPTIVWDLRSGGSVATIDEHAGALEFNRDGSVLLTVQRTTSGDYFEDGPAHTWRVDNGAPLAEMLADGFQRVGFTPDGENVVGITSGVVQYWDARTGVEGPSFAPQTDLFMWAVSPDGKSLVVHGDPMLRLDVATGTQRATLDGADCNLGQPVFSPDGRWIAALASYCFGADPTSVLVWDAATGALALHSQDLCCENNRVAFSPDSRMIAVGPDAARQGNGIAVHEVPSGRSLGLYTAPDSVLGEATANSTSIESALGSEFSPDGRSLLVQFYASAGPLTIIFDVASHEAVFGVWGLGNAKFSPDGTMLVGNRYNGNMDIVEVYRL